MTERGAIELIEEATCLFRDAGWSTLGLYYIGALPFVAGFLFFWADMSRDAYAAEHALAGSFGVAALFLWMNVWQALYASELRSRLRGVSSGRWTAARVVRIALRQSAVQPTSLILMPIGALLALPAAWIYGFYQNATVLADDGETSLADILTQAKTFASLWTKQSWLILAIQAGFGLFVAINIAIAMFLLPRLLQILAGVETVFTKSGAHLLSSTFFAVCLGLTYLCVDPIMKAIYTLRCFYGESIRSGADLKAEFRRSIAATSLLIIACALCTMPNQAAAQTQPPAIAAPELDRAIDEVIHQREFTWRLPRQRMPEAESHKNWLVRFTESAWRTVNRWYRQVRRAYSRFTAWLRDLLRGKRHEKDDAGAAAPTGALEISMYALLAAMAGALVFLAIQAIQRRTARDAIATAVAAAPLDLEAGDVGADQLPESGWRDLAQEWIARKDFRMALRALYLASLAYLGNRELIRIHRAKSNRDYQKELERRARSTPELGAAFAANLAVFESSWYGNKETGPNAIDAFVANLDRIKTCAG
jgi:hypothetical protein